MNTCHGHAADAGGRRVSICPFPIPRDWPLIAAGCVVHIASTRNPNQVFDLVPITGM